MHDDRRPSPLSTAALAAVQSGATADDLELRLGRAGARLAPGVADALLTELAHLGLVRVARGNGRDRRFVPTSIGRRRLDDALIGARGEEERLAELEHLRTDLLSTIAHELRTPLTALRTSVGLLQDDEHRPDERQTATLLETIERNAGRMQRLVDDILELARFRSGTISLQLRRFDAAAMAVAAAASIQPLAEGAGQRLALDRPRQPVWVYGDHRRLEQALVNLLSNAQRFSPPDSEIRLTVEARNAEVRWTVADTGPGIEPAYRDRLFERFFVGRSDRAGAAAGVGLGLPTALAIAQGHGGGIEVDSVPGAGSTFTLRVPVGGPEGQDSG